MFKKLRSPVHETPRAQLVDTALATCSYTQVQDTVEPIIIIYTEVNKKCLQICLFEIIKDIKTHKRNGINKQNLEKIEVLPNPAI